MTRVVDSVEDGASKLVAAIVQLTAEDLREFYKYQEMKEPPMRQYVLEREIWICETALTTGLEGLCDSEVTMRILHVLQKERDRRRARKGE